MSDIAVVDFQDQFLARSLASILFSKRHLPKRLKADDCPADLAS